MSYVTGSGWLISYGERRVKAMERLAWRASPKFDREEVIQFARQLKELRSRIRNGVSERVNAVKCLYFAFICTYFCYMYKKL